MGAGRPDWKRLHELGKLPEDARGNVPMLAQLDEANEKIKELEAELVIAKEASEETSFTEKCEVEGCVHNATGRSEALAKNYLRLHMRTHEAEEKTKA